MGHQVELRSNDLEKVFILVAAEAFPSARSTLGVLKAEVQGVFVCHRLTGVTYTQC